MFVLRNVRDIGPGRYGSLTILKGFLVTHDSPYRRSNPPVMEVGSVGWDDWLANQLKEIL